MPDTATLSQFALMAFSSVFILVDPFTTAPLFLAMTAGDPPARRRLLAWRAALAAFLTLTAFALLGNALLRLFALTLSAFRIAGGVLLFGIALNMLRVRELREVQTPEEVQEGAAKEDIALIPLAIPMLSGPGAITTVIVLAQQSPSLAHTGVLLGAIGLTCALTYVILASAVRVTRFLGQTGLRVLSRLMGLLLAAIAAQFVLTGMEETLLNLLRAWASLRCPPQPQ
ncbi:MAG: UPF0056 inner membrane protein [Candidatus Tectimicrobiota bacterium]|nr:MAG: UPF0056 inner membrane protein [Candidatus Tectomicrobia bacterium]